MTFTRITTTLRAIFLDSSRYSALQFAAPLTSEMAKYGR